MSSEENNRDRYGEDESQESSAAESEPTQTPETEDLGGVEGEVISEGGDSPDDPEAYEPVEDPETPGDERVAALAAELEVVRAERDEHLDSVKRLKAEFENSRKRQERERERILESASENLVKQLLPVIDNLDRALDAEGDIRGGVSSTRDQLASVLGEAGLSVVASDGQTFDPNVHEAVMGQPSEEHEDGTVIQTFERGYVLNGKSIRPAKVVVARQS